MHWSLLAPRGANGSLLAPRGANGSFLAPRGANCNRHGSHAQRGSGAVLLSASLLALALSACTADPCHRLAPGEVAGANACRSFPPLTRTDDDAVKVAVSGDLLVDTRWTADKVWVLRDFVYVRAPATLSIEAGTRILGERGSSLIITRGAKIHAVGTRERPIVFTSAVPPGGRYRGDWGGVSLLGRAPINVAGGVNVVAGVPVFGGRGEYGGNDPEDSSGVLNYVRIEFAGYAITPDVKLNGLTSPSQKSSGSKKNTGNVTN